jgi:release factor glutamine methyltransferase
VNVLEVIQSAAGYLAKHNVESPRLQAEHLLAKVLGCRRMDLYLQFDRPVNEAERAPLRELVRRRAAREPLQHLLGEWDFYGRTFQVDSRALIPRPETEELVAAILRFLPKGSPLRLADIGTGTGAIAVTLSIEHPTWSIAAWDISTEALTLAEVNAQKLAAVNVTFHQGDLLPTSPPSLCYDAIVANLPYIRTQELPGLEPEVHHDPVLALDGGADGLELIRRLIPQAALHLAPQGWIFLEIGQSQSDSVKQLFAASDWTEVSSWQDCHGVERFVRAQRIGTKGEV